MRRSNGRRVRIIPYRANSASARALSRATGVLRVPMSRQTRFIGRDLNDVLVNWGYGYSIPRENQWDRVTWVNGFWAVNRARNKIYSFRAFNEAGVTTLDWTTGIDGAYGWHKDGHTVVCRGTITGQGGSGIVVVDQSQQASAIPRVPLYTRYEKRKHEYRVHVWCGEVLDVQQKRKRRGVEVDPHVRSYANGWVFCREDVNCPAPVASVAVAAVRALGLDFGAVDVGWNALKERAFVFEVNTAPGLEGATLEKYATKIRELAQ